MNNDIKTILNEVACLYFTKNKEDRAAIIFSHEENELDSVVQIFADGLGRNFKRVSIATFYSFLDANKMHLTEQLKLFCNGFDVIFLVPSDSAFYRGDIFSLLMNGYHLKRRIVILSSFSKNLIQAGFGEKPEDMELLGKWLLKSIMNFDEMQVTSNSGTKLSIPLKYKKRISLLVGKFKVGEPENLPSGELFWCPLRGLSGNITLRGGTVQNRLFKKHYDGEESLELEITSGIITNVKGTQNRDVKEVKKIISVDSNAKRIGKISFGLNRKIPDDVKMLALDEKRAGFHLVVGMPCPTRFGYAFYSSSRLWFHIKEPTIIFNNLCKREKSICVMKNGTYLF